MNKRAISNIVSTTLIIVIVVAAVGIIGAFVLPMVKNSLNSGSSCNTAISEMYIDTSSGYSCIDLDKNLVSIQIKKQEGSLEYLGIKINTINRDGNSRQYYIKDSFGDLSSRIIHIYDGSSSVEEIESISLIPIVKQNNNAIECEPTSSVKLLYSCSLGRESLNSQLIYVDSSYSSGSGRGADREISFLGDHLELIHSGKVDIATYLNWTTRPDGNLLNYSSWNEGDGNILDFAYSATGGNYRIQEKDPWNRDTIIWEAKYNGKNYQGGGWNAAKLQIDNNKTYRFSVWTNRKLSGQDGKFLFGIHAYNRTGGDRMIGNLNSGINYNPYFFIDPSPRERPGDIIVGEWILAVGHIFPHNYIGGNHSDSGKYFLNGTKMMIGYVGDYKWLQNSSSVSHRNYLYYVTDPNVRQQFVYPRIDVIDGTEPSIQELLNGYDSVYDSIHRN